MRKRARISLICLSCMVLLSAIRGGLFFSYYLLSPKEFTANVQKHCDGKCFLAKVSSDNTQEQTNIKFDFTKHQAEVFCMEIPTFEPLYLPVTEKSLLFYYHFSTYETIDSETLRPPVNC